jgi:L-iditol 2-dehydrogenase
VIFIDVRDDRLELAKKIGATQTFRADHSTVLDELRKFDPITHSIECSGAEASIDLAIRATSAGGKAILVGRSAQSHVRVPIFDAADKEIDLVGSFRYKNTYPKALQLVASGRIDVKPLITHHFKLEQVIEAFEMGLIGRDGAVKIMIHVNEDTQN